MSKSKRAAQGIPSPAPRQEKSVFVDREGRLRAGWLLAVSLFSYGVLTVGVRLGLTRAFAALFQAWGIDAANAWRAPGWAQLIYAWHGSVVTLILAALTLGLCRWLRRLWKGSAAIPGFQGKRLLWAFLAGCGGALLVAALCLLPDSVRMEWPLIAPRLSWSIIPLCVVSLIATVAEEVFSKRVLYDGLRERWGRAWATAVVCGAFFLTAGGYAAGPVGAVNVLLLGLVGCLIYKRYGLWAVAGFRWGWSALNMFVLGFGGGEASVYRLYAVSEALLTGGDAGPVYGLWTTLLLAGTAAVFLYEGKKMAV